MKKIACLYFEGNDSKIALFEKEGEEIKMLKAESIDTSLAFSEKPVAAVNKSEGNVPKKDTLNYDFSADESIGFTQTFLNNLNVFFAGEDLNKISFIPILCEPSIYFQKIHNEKELADLNINNNGKIDRTIDFITLQDDSKIAVYSSGKSSYLQALDSLARLNSKRLLKIVSVKSAEISLASYIAREYEFSNDDITLVLYVGKEYSKLLFIKGEKILHIGSKLSVGKNSFNPHNVIVSKILLEIEQGEYGNVNNILICGEDDSKDLKNVLKEAYPASVVHNVGIDTANIKNIDAFSIDSAFIVPFAVADEYFAEQDKQFKGLNLLPKYIIEEQKLFHFGWQGYLMMLLIFLSAFYFSFRIVSNKNEIRLKDNEINRLTLIQTRNSATVQKIRSYEAKINNVDRTKAILNNLSSGTGILSMTIKKLANFTGQRKNLWINQVTLDKDKNLKLTGFTLSRAPVKTLADSYNKSLLQNIVFNPLREFRVFSFSINAGKISSRSEKNEQKK